MPELSDTMAPNPAPAAHTDPNLLRNRGRLVELAEFGSNPGALRAYVYVPERLTAVAPLVVVLHGCGQTAKGYDVGSGWSEMADRLGFALVFPEQQRQNNPNLCFNWFSPEDNRRGSGEALSIRQMVDTITRSLPIDPARVYVTGLSAGGAMTSTMLACYPEVFAGGAIVAGLPYGCARTLGQAFTRMRGRGIPDSAKLGALVRRAAPHHGAWPIVSIWHGSRDTTVNPANADAIASQWCAVQGLNPRPQRTETVQGYPRRVWCNAQGREVIEEYSITGMGHGTPLDTVSEGGCGKPGPFMIEAKISSTRQICRFWNLAGAPVRIRTVQPSAPARPVREQAPVMARSDDLHPHRATVYRRGNEAGASRPSLGKLVRNALRTLGLFN